jgi:hypothetical protein
VRRGERERKRKEERQKGNKEDEKNKEEEKRKKRKGLFSHFTTSIQEVKTFCQTFSKTVSEKPLYRVKAVLRSRSPTK